MKTRGNHRCVTLLLWLLIIRRVKTDGKLDIRFLKYLSDGTKVSGVCCDGKPQRRCPDTCDRKFTLCIDRPDGTPPCSVDKRTANVTYDKNLIHFGNSIHGTANPFIIHVPKALPSSLNIFVQVYDNDGTSSDELMDTLSQVVNITAAPTELTAPYTQYMLRGRTVLRFAVRAYCDTDWYGSTCEKYCKSTTGHSHYTCNHQTGAKLCFEGWKGDNCDQVIDECTKTDNTCHNGGSCRNTLGSFKCFCIEGIQGRRCENIINQCALKPCLNGGTCDGNERDYNCTCSVEWTGETCAERANVCDSRPCSRGNCTPDLLAATRFKCNCDFGWVGDKCSQSVDILNITLLGEIDHTNRGDLAGGLNRLYTELGGIPGKVDVKFTATIQKKSNYITTYIQVYCTLENGSFLESPSMDGIFESIPEEDISEYLPLPLYHPPEEKESNTKSSPDSWDMSHYVSAILPVGLVLMTVLFLVAFCIWRRGSSRNMDENQISLFVLDVSCNRNLQPPNAMTGRLQHPSVPPAGYTSLRFLRVDEGSLDIQRDGTSTIKQPPEDITLDAESLQGSSGYPAANGRLGDEATLGTHADVTSSLHIVSEDMTLDDVIAHCFGVSSDDNARLGDAATLDTNCDNTSNLNLTTEELTHGRGILHAINVSPHVKISRPDVATLRQVTEDLTFDPVMLQDPSGSPHEHARRDEATLRDVYVETLNTHCDETTGTRTLDSARLRRPSGYPDDHARVGEVGTRRHVTSYIQPVTEDMTLHSGSVDAKVEDAEYTVIDDEDVEEILEEHPYERIESVDYNDIEDISQKDPYEKINV